MSNKEEFYEEEDEVTELGASENDVYGKEGVAEAMDDDSISPEEEGFMQGYNGTDDDEE